MVFAGGGTLRNKTIMSDPPLQFESAEIRRVQPDGALLLYGSNLRVRVAVLKPGVLLASAHGEVLDAQDARVEAELLLEFDRELERAGSLTVFADLRESPHMPAASRKRIAHWMRRHQTRLVPAHVLVRSQLIEMALAMLAMLVGGALFKIHTNPQAFLALVRKAAPKLSALPAVPEP
jgi:hypothetical protein